MLNHEITSIVGKHKHRRIIGRGTGTGHGKTSGRGHKGAGSRAGSTAFSLFEGGQIPLFRKLPKRGFSNFNFAQRCEIVNICQLERFEDGAVIGIEQLISAGLIDSDKSTIKILGKGDLTKKLQVNVHKFSKSAEQKITAIGGTVNMIKKSG